MDKRDKGYTLYKKGLSCTEISKKLDQHSKVMAQALLDAGCRCTRKTHPAPRGCTRRT